MYNEFTRAAPGDDANERADTLKRTLDERRHRQWESSTESIDFSHSSHQTWQLLNRLTGRTKKTLPCPMSTIAIASKLIDNGHHHNVDAQVSRKVNAEIASLRACNLADGGTLTEVFTEDKMAAAVKRLKSGKAQGPDRIAPEFVINCGTPMLAWLGNSSLTACQPSASPRSGIEQMSLQSSNQTSPPTMPSTIDPSRSSKCP